MAEPFCLVRAGPQKERELATRTGHFNLAVPYYNDYELTSLVAGRRGFSQDRCSGSAVLSGAFFRSPIRTDVFSLVTDFVPPSDGALLRCVE